MESELIKINKKGIKMLLAELKKIQDNSYNVEIDSVVKNDVTITFESLSVVDTLPEYFYNNDSSASEFS